MRERVERGLLVEASRRSAPIEERPLAERMARLDVPGVGVAVIADGKIDWAAGYGVREAGGGVPVTARTLFQAASISKPVTALAVMRLVAEGRLDLDEDVNAYLRSWWVPANGAWQPRLTLRYLLSHTGGTTVHGFPGYRSGRPLPTLGQVLDGEEPANTGPVRVNALPGVAVRYSGGGTSIVQQVLVDVVGMPFPALMRELVLAPLEMADSTYEQPLPPQRAANAAVGHRLGGAPVAGGWHVYPEMAAAGLWTTPDDLARVALEVQRARTGSGRLLTREAAAEMLTPQAGGSFGIGFWLAGDGETRRFGHGGDNEGFKCELVAYVEHGLGAAVMTNGDEGWALCQEILGGIARAYGWPVPPGDRVGTFVPPPTRTESDPAAAAAYAGEYELRPGFRLRLTAGPPGLVLQPSGQPPVPLIPTAADAFSAEAIDIDITFRRNDAGEVTGLTLRQDSADHEASKQP